MPLFDFICSDGHRTERYLSRRENPDPACSECDKPTKRLISRFAAIWTRNISEYGDKRKETYYKDLKNEGHTVARKRSGGGTAERPVFERITSVAQQRAYCREEGLLDPGDIGNMEVHADGVGCTTQGMPGSWT